MLVNSPEELTLLIQESSRRHHHTNYAFINAHNGYRNGKMHLLIGPSSGGKSTLTRSLLLDFVLNLKEKEKIHIHLSEESEVDFVVEFGASGVAFDVLKKITFTSEQDKNYGSANELMQELSLIADRPETSAVLFDNITTSICYMDKRPDDQALVAKKIKQICKNSNVPFILIAHTGGQQAMATNRLLEMNDIRGGKSIVNLAEFMYILQPIFVGESRYNILTIVKHRGCSIKNSCFNLTYSHRAKVFVKDEAISFAKFKEIFKERNVL